MSENNPIGYANEFLTGWGPIYQTRDIAKAQAGLTSFKNVRRIAVPVYDTPPTTPALDELVAAVVDVLECAKEGREGICELLTLHTALNALTREGGE